MMNLNKLYAFSHVSCSDVKNGTYSSDIDDARNTFYGYDKKLLVKKIEYKNIFNKESGQFDVELGGYLLQCFYYDNLSSDKDNSLVVGLNGARLFSQLQEDPNNNKPNFKRWSYYSLNNGCYLNIDDPMFKKFPKLLLGWYYGCKENSALDPIIKLIHKITKFRNISHSNVVFFSSSGGGYACIQASIMLPGSLSISINPQLYIQNYPYASSFKKITGIDLTEEDNLLRNNLAENIKKNSKSKHLIIVNTECYEDMRDHLVPFSKEIGINLRYGLSIKDNVLIWCYQACRSSVKTDPHISYETKYIYSAIEYISEQFKKSLLNENTLELYQPLVLLINEFWNDYYKMNLSYSQLQQNSIVFLDNIKEQFANKLLEKYTDIQINANAFNYNCWKLPIIQKNSLYTIHLSGIKLTGNQSIISIALYDLEGQKRIVRRDINYSHTSDVYFNFITNNLEQKIVFHVYCGEVAKTQEISLFISNVTVYCNKDTWSVIVK